MNQYLTYTLEKMASFAEPSGVKIVASGVVSAVLFLFGNLYHDALVAVIMLMVIDFVLAISAAKRNGEPITSNKASRSIVKGIVYLSSISAGYFADSTIPGSFMQSSMIAFVGVTEFISILENVGKHGYATPRRLLNQLYNYQKHK